MTGKLTDASKDFKSGKMRLTVTLDEHVDPDYLDSLLAQDRLTIEMKPYRRKRSKDANAYCWVLIGKLAAKIGTTPRQIYREAIRDIGDNYEIVCVRNAAVDRLRSSWEGHGLGWVTDTLDSKIQNCTNVVLYYGSSTYTTDQMARLINTIITECRAQNIETATPEEISLMLGGKSNEHY